MEASSFVVLAQQMVGATQSAGEFSASTTHHAMASAHGWQDAGLVTFGAIVVIMTTIYTVMRFLRPGEMDQHHIKRRIIDDGHEGSR
jgi:hypothetical protein